MMIDGVERRFWWHWQNLNDQRGRPQGLGLFAGRAWFHFFKWQFCIEWSLAKFRFGLRFDSGENITLGMKIPGVALYFSVSPPWGSWLSKWNQRHMDREFDLSIHDWIVWFKPWG